MNSEENADEAKAVFLKGMYELLCSEGGKSPHAPMLPVSVDTGRKGLTYSLDCVEGRVLVPMGGPVSLEVLSTSEGDTTINYNITDSLLEESPPLPLLIMVVPTSL